MPCIEWDATKNAQYDRHISPPMTKLLSPGEVGCTMSHILLWRKLAECENPEATMLILEDDAQFYISPDKNKRFSRGEERGVERGHYNQETNNGNFDFFSAFSTLWKGVPDDWEILYLGFSDRGSRLPVADTRASIASPPKVTIFRPTYGFHTHAYAIKKSAALKFL